MMQISDAVRLDLVTYLLAHEGDIAYSINDYSDLHHVFHAIIGRQPMEMRTYAAVGEGKGS